MSILEDYLNNDFVDIDNVEVLNRFPNTLELNFTEEELEDYAKNTNEIINNKELKPNLKISHSDQQVILKELFKLADPEIWEEMPNLGLLENFRRKGDKVYADIKRVPKKMKELVFGGRLFTSLSPELVRNWRGTGKNIIRAVALSNIPSMKHVLDVPMSQGLAYRGYLTLEDTGGSIMGDNTNKDTQTLDAKSVETIIDQKLEKNNEGLLTKFSEMVKGIVKPFQKNGEDSKHDKTDDKMISMAEVQTLLSEQNTKFEEQMERMKSELVAKDKNFVNLSEEVKTQKQNAKKAEADAICKQASMDGVPKYVVSLFKPVLMSELGDEVIQMSEVIENKDGQKETIEVKRKISDFVTDLFKNYPNKVNMSEDTRTFLSAVSDDEEKQIAERTKVLMSEGMDKHTALMQAGAEIRKS